MLEYYGRIKQDELEVIANLSIDGLMNFIDKLVRKYYLSYVNNDADKCESILKFIKDIVYMNSDYVDLLYEFVNYSMLNNANLIITSLFDNDIRLYPFYKVELESFDGFNGLSQSIRRSLNMKIDKVDKINIRNLHNLCSNDKNLNSEIREIADALYDSFNDK